MTNQLSAPDKAQVAELIESATAAASVDQFVESVLTGLLRLVPGQDVSWNELNMLEQTTRIVVKPDPVGYEHLVARFGEYAEYNPLVRHVQATGDTRTLILSDFIEPQAFRRTPLYTDIFQVIGIETQMVLPLPAPPGVVIGFACNRDETGFSERDRLVMDSLRPYLTHAYRAAQLREGSDLLRRALSATGWSVALVNDSGAVAELTDGTTESLREVGVELVRGGHIPETLEPAFAAQVGGYNGRQPAVRSAPVPLSDVPHAPAGSVVPSPTGPHLVLVQPGTQAETQALAEMGLTPRQIDVAVALADGGTNQQIARRLGLAEGTVKKHLEAVYRLLEVDNRTSAAAKVRALG